MNLTEIKKSLEHLFATELPQGAVRHIVFWYDDDGAFAEDVNQLDLSGVETIFLYPNNMFATKMHIEVTQVTDHILVYSPHPRPANRENWLTDILYYSQVFTADETTNTMLLLSMQSNLRHVVAKYKLFFRSADRMKRFQSYQLTYDDTTVPLGIHATLCKLLVPTLDGIVQALLSEYAMGETTLWDTIQKLGDPETLWDFIRKNYGYHFPENNLDQLAVMLLTSHLNHSLHCGIPNSWQPYISSNSNCFVLTDTMMRNSQPQEAYDRLADFVANKLDLHLHLENWTTDDLVECDTFPDFDKYILSRIRESLDAGICEFDHYRKIINSRKNRRYYGEFATEYQVLFYACDYLELAARHKDLYGCTLPDLFESYTKDLHKLDGAYRHFFLSYDQLADSDDYMTLRDTVENSYTNWFLYELSKKWCDLLDGESWGVPGISPQQEFYNKYVYRYVHQDDRIFVIISDGLRYESAVELNAILNQEQKGVCQLDAMVGALPSITALGMAALLPHRHIEFSGKQSTLVDGISSQGTENRQKILQTYKSNSIAVTFDQIIDLNKQQMTSLFSGMKLIYIYHNVIDASGDNAPTEHKVFQATERTFQDMDKLIRKLRNNISAINILITADHGYLYRRTKLEQCEKTPKEALSSACDGRRYLLTEEPQTFQGVQRFSMDYLNHEPSNKYALIPRAINCFKVQGAGSCYVHGGSSLQEVTIPVLRFKSDKNLAKSMGAQKVKVELTNLSRKITSVISHLTFFQTEPVTDKNRPRSIAAYFIDNDGQRISNENIIFAESTSQDPKERTYKEKFTLKDMAYEKNKPYFLVLVDEEEMVNKELQRISFTIDLVFGGSIGF